MACSKVSVIRNSVIQHTKHFPGLGGMLSSRTPHVIMESNEFPLTFNLLYIYSNRPVARLQLFKFAFLFCHLKNMSATSIASPCSLQSIDDWPPPVQHPLSNISERQIRSFPLGAHENVVDVKIDSVDFRSGYCLHRDVREYIDSSDAAVTKPSSLRRPIAFPGKHEPLKYLSVIGFGWGITSTSTSGSSLGVGSGSTVFGVGVRVG